MILSTNEYQYINYIHLAIIDSFIAPRIEEI